MNVTREIVKDLLPLYAAGEAGADTRAAVELLHTAFVVHDDVIDDLTGEGKGIEFLHTSFGRLGLCSVDGNETGDNREHREEVKNGAFHG